MLEAAEIQIADLSSEELKLEFYGQLLKMSELTAKSIHKLDHFINALSFFQTHCGSEMELM